MLRCSSAVMQACLSADMYRYKSVGTSTKRCGNTVEVKSVVWTGDVHTVGAGEDSNEEVLA